MGVKLLLLGDVLAVATENYKDNLRVLAALDDKAQKMGGVAGLFLAVPFALVKPDTLGPLRNAVGMTGLLLLGGSITLFVACIALCLVVMWVRNVHPPPDFVAVKALVDDLLRLASEKLTEERQESYCSDKLIMWQQCLASQEQIVRWKWILLLTAQIVLGIALLPVGV